MSTHGLGAVWACVCLLLSLSRAPHGLLRRRSCEKSTRADRSSVAEKISALRESTPIKPGRVPATGCGARIEHGASRGVGRSSAQGVQKNERVAVPSLNHRAAWLLTLPTTLPNLVFKRRILLSATPASRRSVEMRAPKASSSCLERVSALVCSFPSSAPISRAARSTIERCCATRHLRTVTLRLV